MDHVSTCVSSSCSCFESLLIGRDLPSDLAISRHASLSLHTRHSSTHGWRTEWAFAIR